MFAKLNAKVMTMGTLALMAVSSYAQESGVTIPESGVDVGSYAMSAITKLGEVVAVCIGGVICFMIVRWGIRWIRGIGKG